LGRAVIGGLIASTFAALFFLPLIFAWVQRKTTIASVSLDPQIKKVNIIYRHCMNKMRNRRSSTAFMAACVLTAGKRVQQLLLFRRKEKDKSKSEPVKKDSAAAPAATFQLQRGQLSTDLFVPGELIAFQQVDLYAKVNSFVKKLFVDVGSE